MTFKTSFSSFIILVSCLGCTSGTPFYRLNTSHEVCGKDQEKMQKLSEADAQEFFNIVAPFADLDRAVQVAPKKDDGKIKRPDIQDKVVTDLREKCLLNEKESLGKDFENQTFKYKRKTVEKDTTKSNVTCPVAVIEEVIPLETAPALDGAEVKSEDKNVIRSVKADATVSWQKQDPNYKLLGAFSSMTLKGAAETLWYKKLPVDQAEPGFQNIILFVRENFNLNLNLDGNKSYEGHYSTCRKLQEDIDSEENPEKKRPDIRYEATVTRIGLKIDKEKVNEGKFITVLKYVFDAENTKTWVLDRAVRSDFYMNNIPISVEEIAVLEKKRQESIGFSKPK